MGLHLLTKADLKASDFERLKTGEYESYGALKKSWMLTPSFESKAKKNWGFPSLKSWPLEWSNGQDDCWNIPANKQDTTCRHVKKSPRNIKMCHRGTSFWHVDGRTYVVIGMATRTLASDWHVDGHTYYLTIYYSSFPTYFSASRGVVLACRREQPFWHVDRILDDRGSLSVQVQQGSSKVQ